MSLVVVVVVVVAQLFTGTENSPQAFCNDPTITNESECVGEFLMKLRASRELLATNNNTDEMLVPRVWSAQDCSEYCWFYDPTPPPPLPTPFSSSSSSSSSSSFSSHFMITGFHSHEIIGLRTLALQC